MTILASTTVVLGGCPSAPPLVCDDPVLTRLPGDYKVRTWNLWQLGWPGSIENDERLDAVIASLLDDANDCDVVAIEEAWRDRARDRLEEQLSDRFIVLRGRCCENIPETSPETTSKQTCRCPDAADTGLMVLVRRGQLKVRPGERVLAQRYRVDAGEDAFKNKGFMLVPLVDVNDPSRAFDLYATHLQADAITAGSRRSKEVRTAQLRQLLCVHDDRPETTPALLIGDLNVPRECPNSIDGEYGEVAALLLRRTHAGSAADLDDLIAGAIRARGGSCQPCNWITYDHMINHLDPMEAFGRSRGLHLDYAFSLSPKAPITAVDAAILHPSFGLPGRPRAMADHYPIDLVIRFSRQ